MTLPYLAAWSPRLHALLGAYLPALIAFVLAAAGAVVVRGRWGAWAGLPGAAGTLAGWAALLPPALAWRAALRPRTMPDHLLLPAAAIALLAAAGPRLRGRLARWAPVLAVGFTGWWLAWSPAGRPEFWRVWAAVAAASWLLARTSGAQPVRAWAAALTAWGGLAATATPAVLTAPGLVLAAALAPAALLGQKPGPTPALLVASFLAVADLSVGRAPMGGLNGADLACLATLATPLVAQALQSRLGRRAGWIGPVPALCAAALCAGAAWLGAGLMSR